MQRREVRIYAFTAIECDKNFSRLTPRHLFEINRRFRGRLVLDCRCSDIKRYMICPEIVPAQVCASCPHYDLKTTETDIQRPIIVEAKQMWRDICCIDIVCLSRRKSPYAGDTPVYHIRVRLLFHVIGIPCSKDYRYLFVFY